MPPANKQKSPGGCGRSLYRLAVFCMWSLVALLAIECISMARAAWEASVVGAWVPTAALREGELPPPVHPEEAAGHFADYLATSASTHPLPAMQLPDWVWRRTRNNFSEESGTREKFLELNDDAREYYCLAHAVAAAQFDEKKNMRACYPSYIRGLAERESDGIAGFFMARSKFAMVGKLKEAARGGALPPQFAHAQIEDQGSTFLFVDINPELTAPPPSEDSNWLVPFVRHKPGYRDPGGMYTYNSLGFRGPEIESPRTPGKLRILCLGGSTTFEGLTDDSTYPAILGDKLREALGDDAVETVNGGMNGASSAAHVYRLPDYFAIHPDIVVLYIGINDIAMFMSTWPLRDRLVLNGLGSISLTIRNLFRETIQLPAEKILPHLEAHTLRNIAILAANFQAAGTRVVVCTIPHPDADALSPEEWRYFDYQITRYMEDRALSTKRYLEVLALYNQSLENMCREYGMYLLPLQKHLLARTALYTDHCHMRLEFQQYKADVAAQYLLPMIEEIRSDSARSAFSPAP